MLVFFLKLLCTLFIVTVNAKSVDNTQCPLCGMVGQDDQPFAMMKGDQIIYGCSMGNHDDELYKSAKPHITALNAATSSHCTPDPKSTMGCPVCGMKVDANGCFPSVEFKLGQKLHACGDAHAKLIHDSPNNYSYASAQAYASSQNNNQGADNFCYGGSVMFNGFTFESTTCVTLWFEEWQLDSEVKLAFAHIGIFLLAFAHECLSYFRRLINKSQNKKNRRLNILELSLNSSLFIISIGVGYFLMLVAMTYHAGLFIVTLAGLGIGNIFFAWLQQNQMEKTGKFDHELAKMADPCCDGMVDNSVPDIDSVESNSLSAQKEKDITSQSVENSGTKLSSVAVDVE